MNKLEQAIAAITKHQQSDDKAGITRHGRCQEYLRLALKSVGLKIPNTRLAVEAGVIVAENPGKYGWKAVHSSLVPGLYLTYFHNCGKLPSGIKAGHVGILDSRTPKAVLYSAVNYDWNQTWANDIIGAYQVA